jgi:hypothetical protein
MHWYSNNTMQGIILSKNECITVFNHVNNHRIHEANWDKFAKWELFSLIFYWLLWITRKHEQQIAVSWF